jgi:hypothetical protein
MSLKLRATGSLFCGAVQYEIRAPLRDVIMSHFCK